MDWDEAGDALAHPSPYAFVLLVYLFHYSRRPLGFFQGLGPSVQNFSDCGLFSKSLNKKVLERVVSEEIANIPGDHQIKTSDVSGDVLIPALPKRSQCRQCCTLIYFRSVLVQESLLEGSPCGKGVGVVIAIPFICAVLQGGGKPHQVVPIVHNQTRGEEFYEVFHVHRRILIPRTPKQR